MAAQLAAWLVLSIPLAAQNADGAVAAAAWDLVEVLRRESSFFDFANPWAQMFRSLFQHLAAKKAQDANIGLIQLRTSRLQIGKP